MRGFSASWLVVLALIAPSLRADVGPVLHENFDISGDLAVGPPPELAAALPSNVGIVPADQAPADPAVANNAVEPAERGAEQYRLDGNTAQPDRVGYADPFTPSIPPFKRQFAYDSVNAELQLIVADKTLKPLRGNDAQATPRDDQFFAEVDVTVAPGQAVRLPTVGPSFRIVNSQLAPSAPFALFTDSAENLFIRGSQSGPAKWTAHLAIERAVFGSPFANVPWDRLARRMPSLPSIVISAARPVLERIGVSRDNKPADAVRRLVDYFRGFEPEEKRITVRGVELYREIALSKQGVCRHRSFAFTVTALALGLPTRFVRNEAHAWVEVHDGARWHRIDLGGAAGQMNLTGELGLPYEGPNDPYVWPPRSESGESMVARALSGAGGAGPAGNAGEPLAQPPGALSESQPPGAPAPSSPTPAQGLNDGQDSQIPSGSEEQNLPKDTAALEPSVVTVRFAGATLRRGERFPLRGSALTASGAACALMRVDFELYDAATGSAYSTGTLVTDSNGKYAGELVLPSRVPVGDYSIRASTPGNQVCGSGRTEVK